MPLRPDDFRLRPHEIHVWHSSLAGAEGAPAELALLDDEERERAARLLRADDRKHFIAAHARVRILLGAYLGCAPETVHFGRSEKGKPYVADAGGFRFNASRSGGYAAFAFSRSCEIGIDVEEIAPRSSFVLLVERALGENERAALSALLPSEAEKLFFTFWARKEAYLKARGLGFSVPANQVDTANLKILRVQGRAERVWRVEDIDLNAHYAAAVAGEGNDWRVTAVRAFTAPAPS